MDSVIIISRQIIIMFIILLVGALCYFKGYITKDGTKSLSSVELNIVNPVLIFMSYQTEYNSSMMKGLLWAFFLSALSFAIAIALSMFVVKKDNPLVVVERFSVVYSNCGFMGIPLINNLYGSEGVLYLTAFITLFNLLVWTHGYIIMKGEKDFSSMLKALRSPSVIAVFIGLLFYVTNIRLPEIPATALSLVSDMNTPLAMLIAGATVAQTNIIKAFTGFEIYRVCISRLLIVPLLTFGALWFFPAPLMVKIVVTIAAGCPVATTGTMFAVMMDRNPKKCSEFFAASTLLCCVTLPVITLVCSNFS